MSPLCLILAGVTLWWFGFHQGLYCRTCLMNLMATQCMLKLDRDFAQNRGRDQSVIYPKPRLERGFSHPKGCAMITPLGDPERSMSAIKLRIPREDVFAFNDDLTAWSAAGGIDLRLTLGAEPYRTTNVSSPTLYVAEIDESFFERYPWWRQFMEH